MDRANKIGTFPSKGPVCGGVKTVHVHAGKANIAQARRESRIKQAIPGMAPLSRSIAQSNGVDTSRTDIPLEFVPDDKWTHLMTHKKAHIAHDREVAQGWLKDKRESRTGRPDDESLRRRQESNRPIDPASQIASYLSECYDNEKQKEEKDKEAAASFQLSYRARPHRPDFSAKKPPNVMRAKPFKPSGTTYMIGKGRATKRHDVIEQDPAKKPKGEVEQDEAAHTNSNTMIIAGVDIEDVVAWPRETETDSNNNGDEKEVEDQEDAAQEKTDDKANNPVEMITAAPASPLSKTGRATDFHLAMRCALNVIDSMKTTIAQTRYHRLGAGLSLHQPSKPSGTSGPPKPPIVGGMGVGNSLAHRVAENASGISSFGKSNNKSGAPGRRPQMNDMLQKQQQKNNKLDPNALHQNLPEALDWCFQNLDAIRVYAMMARQNAAKIVSDICDVTFMGFCRSVLLPVRELLEKSDMPDALVWQILLKCSDAADLMWMRTALQSSRVNRILADPGFWIEKLTIDGRGPHGPGKDAQEVLHQVQVASQDKHTTPSSLIDSTKTNRLAALSNTLSAQSDGGHVSQDTEWAPSRQQTTLLDSRKRQSTLTQVFEPPQRVLNMQSFCKRLITPANPSNKRPAPATSHIANHDLSNNVWKMRVSTLSQLLQCKRQDDVLLSQIPRSKLLPLVTSVCRTFRRLVLPELMPGGVVSHIQAYWMFYLDAWMTGIIQRWWATRKSMHRLVTNNDTSSIQKSTHCGPIVWTLAPLSTTMKSSWKSFRTGLTHAWNSQMTTGQSIPFLTEFLDFLSSDECALQSILKSTASMRAFGTMDDMLYEGSSESDGSGHNNLKNTQNQQPTSESRSTNPNPQTDENNADETTEWHGIQLGMLLGRAFTVFRTQRLGTHALRFPDAFWTLAH